MTVTAPDGTRWRVGRQWWPDRTRKHDRADTGDLGPEGGDGGGGDHWWDLDLGGGIDDAFVLLAIVGVVILAILLLTTVVIPVIAFTLELVLVLVLFLGGIAGRVLFRRPWTVRAGSAHREHRWQQVGFRRSGQLRDEVADALAGGRALP